MIQQLRSEIKESSRDVEERLAEKETENEDLQRISEHLGNQLSSLREAFLKQTTELQEAMTQTGSTKGVRSASMSERNPFDEDGMANVSASAENETRTTNGGREFVCLLLYQPDGFFSENGHS